MRVLQINSVCGIRSTGRICTDISDILRQSGFEAKIAYGRETVPDKYKDISYRIGNNISTYVDGLKTRLLDNAGFNSRAATRKFIAWVKQYNPDIIHLHNIHGYYINIEILFNFLKEYGRPVIWTLHDCWAFTGHCSHFTANKCEDWKNGCESCKCSKEYPTAWLFNNSRSNYRKKKEVFNGVNNLTVVTPSKWLKEIVEKSFLCDYPIQVINNGIDIQYFKPTNSDFKEINGLTDKKIILGVASAWGDRKGLADFIKLSDMLDEGYATVLVGLSAEQIKGLPKGITGITRTNNTRELAEIYTAAEVFLNLTYEDNYPTVNLEAQACGTPVLTYATGGSIESVPPENVIEAGNIEAVKNAIYRLPKEKRLYEGSFDKTFAFLKYIDLYKSVLQ